MQIATPVFMHNYMYIVKTSTVSKFCEILSSGIGGVGMTDRWINKSTSRWTGATQNALHHSLNGRGLKILTFSFFFLFLCLKNRWANR